MEIPKRYHTCRKEILRFADLDLKNLGMAKEFADFMAYVDSIEKPDLDAMTTGRWKKLFAVLRILADKTNINYCIYENKYNVFFDVTSNCLGSKEEISEEGDEAGLGNSIQGVKESPTGKLRRYKYEIDQIDLKIAHLQERRKEYVEKMEPLKTELAMLLDELSSYKG